MTMWLSAIFSLFPQSVVKNINVSSYVIEKLDTENHDSEWNVRLAE
jgi:hypothetical protein